MLVYKTTNVVDFGLYHAPYIGIINSEKIIIGLVNIHFRFGYSSILQNAMAIYNIPIFFPKNYLTLTAILYCSIFFYYFIFLLNKKNFEKNKTLYVFNFFIFVFICIKVYRYNDFGNDMPGNLITFLIWSKVLESSSSNYGLNEEHLNKTLLLLLFSSIFITFNKVQFLLSFIPILFLIFSKVNLFTFLKKNIFSLILYTFIVLTFISKNFLISGCLQYPVAFTCSEKVSWTTKNTESITDAYYNYQKGQAWSKDWPNRVKKYEKNEIKNYEEYNKNFNWLAVWTDNYLKKIIKKNLIFIIILVLYSYYLFSLNNNNKKDRETKKLSLILFSFSLFCTIIWFLKFPIFRYGYSFIIITLALLPFIFFKLKDLDEKNFNVLKKFTILFVAIFLLLNLNKTYKNWDSEIWPNVYQLITEDDYYKIYNGKRVKITTNDVCFYEKNLCTNFIPPNNLEIKYYKNYTIIGSNYQYHGSW